MGRDLSQVVSVASDRVKFSVWDRVRALSTKLKVDQLGKIWVGVGRAGPQHSVVNNVRLHIIQEILSTTLDTNSGQW
jgi:hypothetical protein